MIVWNFQPHQEPDPAATPKNYSRASGGKRFFKILPFAFLNLVDQLLNMRIMKKRTDSRHEGRGRAATCLREGHCQNPFPPITT